LPITDNILFKSVSAARKKTNRLEVHSYKRLIKIATTKEARPTDEKFYEIKRSWAG